MQSGKYHSDNPDTVYMNKYTRILKSFNISAFFLCVFFVVFLVSTVEYSRYYWIFIAGAMVFFGNMWFIQKQRYVLAYIIFMFVTCSLLFIFDAGVMNPTRSYIYYIPLVMCNFVIVDPKEKLLKYAALAFTIFCILSTSFFDYTPKLSLHLFKTEHQEIVSYFNVLCAIVMSVLMMEIILRNTNDAEEVIKLQEKSVRTKDQLIKSIAQNIDVGICRTDVGSNRLIYVNRAKMEMFGYSSEEELLKVPPQELYASPEDRKIIVKALETEGAAINVETLFKRKDGSTFWGLMSSTRLVDDVGNVMYDAGLRDITAMKEMKQELIVAKNQAEQASVAKSKFLSTMSHEIRTPMNAVIGITNLMLMKQREDQEESNNLKVLKSSAESLMSLLNNLLDFSRIEAGKIDLYPGYCNLQTLLKQVMDVYTFLAKEKGIELIDDIRLNDDLYEADAARISQVVGNLLSNAIKFTKHGYVKFSAYAIENGPTARVYFQIEDSGIGIEPGQQQNIFDVFTQENPSIARQFGGSGLGLAISNNILKKMNSVITVKSQKNIGSVFTFELELPRKQDNVSLGHKAPATQEKSLKGMEILLAEDNLVNITVARQLLERWHIKLHIAKNGLEVLDLINKGTHIDLILMDLHMPEMDGIEATARVREAGHKMPIIALTADAMADTKDQAIQVGMDDFITKPFNPDDLYNKLFAFKKQNGTST
jgi:PAS domain S-box-containing protein